MDDSFIPFHRPAIGAAERDAALAVLESGWLTTGSRAFEFEDAFQAFTGVKHAVAVNSATAALHLAFEGLGVTRDCEVVVPTYTFTASAETAAYLGGRPVLVDVEPETFNVSARAVEAAITPKTKAVEVVHIAGLPVDLPAVQAAIETGSRRAGLPGDLPIVEDAAHAFPSPIAALGGRFAGTVGRAGAFSFYATKTITTGEGGMLATDDDALAARARTMRLHGISRDAWDRYTAAGSWYYEVIAAGYKDNLTDLAAAIGTVQLRRARELREARAAIAACYLRGLAAESAAGRLFLPHRGTADEHAWHLFIIRLGPAARPGDRVDMRLPGVAGLPEPLRAMAARRALAIEQLKRAGIGTSVHFIPLHLHPMYQQMGYTPGDFPNAEQAYAGAISLPIWPGMSDEQVDRVIDAVGEAVR